MNKGKNDYNLSSTITDIAIQKMVAVKDFGFGEEIPDGYRVSFKVNSKKQADKIVNFLKSM